MGFAEKGTTITPSASNGVFNGVNPTMGLWRWITSRRLQRNKEEMMKRFTYLTVVLMIGFMLIGCSAMTAEQRKEQLDLRSSVGNSPFVGGISPGVGGGY